MFESVLLMGGLGLIIGGVLAMASKIFYVYVDPKVEAIEGALPGANCGGCGYPGCGPNAEAIVAGKSTADSCVAAGADVAAAIAGIMGVSIGEKEPEFASPGCYYKLDQTDIKYLYSGIEDCRAAALVSGGMKECRIGCLGFGTCATACMFGALSMGEDRLPKVDQEKCTGCGACEKICPKHIIRLTSVTRRIINEYTEDQCVTPCQRACPTGIDIREYVKRIKEGDDEGAVQVIKERNSFPTVIGRICPALCETECRRQLVDEPVAINHLKRFVCDLEMKNNKRVQPYKAPASGKKIAVIGGGVAGLSTAFFAARLGHTPVIYEGSPMLGGLLRYAIPEERLPQDVLDWDIDGILDMGVKAKTSMKAGKDFTIPGLLKSGYDAVFTATGSWDGRIARGDGESMESVFPGVYLLIDLLRSATGKASRIPMGNNIVIAGGGALAADAAALCRELGADAITVVVRDEEGHASMDEKALETLKAANASVVFQTGITRLSGEEDLLTGLELTDLVTGEKSIIKADTLFISSGGFPEFVFIPARLSEEDSIEIDVQEKVAEGPFAWEAVEVYKKPAGGAELGMLSAKDMLSGYSAAVSAINGGRKAAASIHAVMYNLPLVMEKMKVITENSQIQQVTQVDNVQILPRMVMPAGYMGSRAPEEYPEGFTEAAARKESDRCLRCGILCYERSVEEENDPAVDNKVEEKAIA